MLTYKQYLESLENKVMYHVTPTKNLKYIMKEGLIPSEGDLSSSYGENEERVYLFPDLISVEDALQSWMEEVFDDPFVALLKVNVNGLKLGNDVDWEYYTNETIEPNRLKVLSEDIYEESDIGGLDG